MGRVRVGPARLTGRAVNQQTAGSKGKLMRKWRPTVGEVAKTLAHQCERQFRWLRATTKRSLGRIDPVKILPYRGYGDGRHWQLMGRVVEDRDLGSPQEDDTGWQNVKAMYRRFVVDEIPGVSIRATAHGQSLETETDAYGYFRFDFRFADPVISTRSWQTVDLELLDEVCPDQARVATKGAVLVAPQGSRFGVISDVDDTIIQTYATDFLRMARMTFLNNVKTRTPLPGVSRFYRALERGTGQEACNPVFYVSSSAWNLYDLFSDFLDLHNIPTGPILMQDLRLDNKKFIKSGHEHKFEKIASVITNCGNLPFVLVGDAGQDDPVIYREVVRRYPGRILAIYIRTVGSERRNERVRQMVRESEDRDVPMMLIEDIEEAMEHAAALGLVCRDPAVANDGSESSGS